MTTSAREPSPGGDLLPEDILISSVTRVLQLRTKWQLWDPVIDDSRIMWAILPASVAWLVSVLLLPVTKAAPTTTDARLDNFDYDGNFKEKVTAINPVRGARWRKRI
jgi:hypothetical protein